MWAKSLLLAVCFCFTLLLKQTSSFSSSKSCLLLAQSQNLRNYGSSYTRHHRKNADMFRSASPSPPGTEASEPPLNKLTVVQLKAKLRDFGLPVVGKKQDLVIRLEKYYAVIQNLSLKKDDGTQSSASTDSASLEPGQKPISPLTKDGVELLVRARTAARRLQEFPTADWLHSTLTAEGILLTDNATDHTSTWKASGKRLSRGDSERDLLSHEYVDEVVRLRVLARTEGDYATADLLKDQLEAMGYLLLDRPRGEEEAARGGAPAWAFLPPLAVPTAALQAYLEDAGLDGGKGRRAQLYERCVSYLRGGGDWLFDQEGNVVAELAAFARELAEKPKTLTLVVEVPPEHLGRVIGKGGDMIASIQKKTSTHFQVVHDCPEDAPTRQIIIQGQSRENLEKAEALVQEVIDGSIRPGQKKRADQATSTKGVQERKARTRRQGSSNTWFEDDFRGTRLFVTNIPFDATWAHLKDHFQQVGHCVYASISENPDGTSKGHGIIQFETTAEAQRAVMELEGSEFLGRQLGVRPDLQEGSQKRERQR